MIPTWLILIGLAGGLLMLVGGLALIFMLGRGQPTPDELARQQFLRDQAARRKRIKRVAKQLRGEVIHGLALQGFLFVHERQGAVVKASYVESRLILCTDDAIYIKLTKLPFKVAPFDLIPPEVARNLSVHIGRQCKVIVDTYLGVWVFVELASGVGDIPKWFSWTATDDPLNAMSLLPKTNSFAVAIGVGEGRKLVYEDVRDWPHVIIAGATDGGKSVFMNQLLCTLISRNTPDQMKLVLVDLKGGLEFWDYREVPHLLRPVIIDKSQVVDALTDMVEEKNKRFDMLRNHGLRNIAGWNQTHHHSKLPYIFLFFDEIAALMQDSKIKRRMDGLIEDLAAQGRAVGIHATLCTQLPTKDVLSTIVRGNIVTRIAFALDPVGSLVALGNGAASNLPPKTGRAIYRRGLEEVELQAPFISDAQIKETIAKLLPAEEPGRVRMTEYDLFRVAIDNLGGVFTKAAVLAQTGGRWAEIWNAASKKYPYDFDRQEPIIELDGEKYIMGRVPMLGGKGAVLLPVSGHRPANQAEFVAAWKSRKSEVVDKKENDEVGEIGEIEDVGLVE